MIWIAILIIIIDCHKNSQIFVVWIMVMMIISSTTGTADLLSMSYPIRTWKRLCFEIHVVEDVEMVWTLDTMTYLMHHHHQHHHHFYRTKHPSVEVDDNCQTKIKSMIILLVLCYTDEKILVLAGGPILFRDGTMMSILLGRNLITSFPVVVVVVDMLLLLLLLRDHS